MARDVHTFVQGLGGTHGTGSRKAQTAGCLLLQGTGDKSRSGLLCPLALFQLCHHVLGPFQTLFNGAGHKSFTARLATDASGKKLLPKNTKLCCAVGAVATPLLNTFWFMLSLCVFFFNTEYVQSLCATFGTTNPFLFVCAFVGVQALIEAVGCGIVATLVTVPLLKFLKK